MMDWTEAVDARLRALWDEGRSASVIGNMIGTNKNSVIGRARRIGCTPRKSPVIRTYAPKKPHVKRGVAGAVTLPPMARAPAQVVRLVLSPRPCDHACCWPLGDPGTPAFRFCDGAAPRGRSYCEVHAAVAYKSATLAVPAVAEVAAGVEGAT